MERGSEDKATGRLLEEYLGNESRLKAYLRRFIHDRHEIEDICQETILRSLEAVRTRDIREPGPFLFGVARNIVRKEFERKSRALIDFVSDFTPDDHAVDGIFDDQMAQSERLILLGETISKLPPQCQRVFVMKKVYGYSHKEIAKMLDIAVSTVEKHAATGLKRCSQELSPDGDSQISNKSVISLAGR